MPSLQSDDAIVLVRERERWRGHWGSRGWRDEGWRFRGDDGWRFRDDYGWRGFRGDGPWRSYRRHPGLDDVGPLFGLGQRYFFGPRYPYFDGGYGRRRKAPWW
jgi:hypothetical protein